MIRGRVYLVIRGRGVPGDKGRGVPGDKGRVYLVIRGRGVPGDKGEGCTWWLQTRKLTQMTCADGSVPTAWPSRGGRKREGDEEGGRGRQIAPERSHLGSVCSSWEQICQIQELQQPSLSQLSVMCV